ncbi:unnamed protein product [Citrullus colocynthis]|uniref:Uncharacterized protein n=1 Tax=Citrullus colocynthis TaxID=252529 RepID=A0ABP0YBD3_9ROSI
MFLSIKVYFCRCNIALANKLTTCGCQLSELKERAAASVGGECGCLVGGACGRGTSKLAKKKVIGGEVEEKSWGHERGKVGRKWSEKGKWGEKKSWVKENLIYKKNLIFL